jgi:hypothetical protein
VRGEGEDGLIEPIWKEVGVKDERAEDCHGEIIFTE